VLRRTFGLKRDDTSIIGGWRKLRNEELHSLYLSPSIIIMTKSRKMRLAVYAAPVREKGFDGKVRRKETTRKT
jgi:hypothetical protein